MNLTEMFRGRELWRSINRSLVIIIYSILIFGAMIFRKSMGWVLLGVFIFISVYINFFTNHLRNMEKRDKGNEVFGGWVEHSHGQGEEKFFYPKKIEPYSRLSEDDRGAVDDFIVYIKELTKERIKLGDDVEPTKLLTYDEIEINEKEELEKFKDEFEKDQKEKELEIKELEELEKQGEQEDG